MAGRGWTVPEFFASRGPAVRGEVWVVGDAGELGGASVPFVCGAASALAASVSAVVLVAVVRPVLAREARRRAIRRARRARKARRGW